MDAKGEGVLLYYKFAFVPEPQTLGLWFQTLCSSLNLVGRVRVAPDGVNVTIGGPLISLSKHIDAVKAHPWLGDCDFKLAPACTTALNRSSIASEVGFGSLSVRIVKELVTLGIHPSESLSISDAGVHLSPIEFHRKIEAECTHTSISNGVDSIDLNDPVSLAGESKIQNAVIASFESDGNVSHGYPGQDNSKMIILDVRNIYETRIGKFVPPEDIECLDPQIRQYSDLPQWIDSNAERLRNKSILMYCTGGVRCEMASAYIKKKGSGFQNVFQLSGGIQRYLETFPDGGFFKGKNFVFDHRVAVPSVCPDILGACTKCGVPFDDYTSRVRCSHCRMLVLVCNDCQLYLG